MFSTKRFTFKVTVFCLEMVGKREVTPKAEGVDSSAQAKSRDPETGADLAGSERVESAEQVTWVAAGNTVAGVCSGSGKICVPIDH